ncbi:PKD domain-containing protein [Polaribacter sp. KT25b]|uniref:PKD domain-containing protein n=1 Tax=Polaribacter sp. KT25b TaxID=1855336 RepID=UPI00087C8D23|nr:PKD domain-containing protein [Polaribacter sp. KT25b]SDS06573.1 PKD domain-containing protein [Polaribacter sp. KT25b]
MKNNIKFKRRVSLHILSAFVLIGFISLSSCVDALEYDLAEAGSKEDLNPPAASFKETVTSDYLTYTFANTSSSATDYLWDFGYDGDGDGVSDSSTELDAEYTYPYEGSFTISLTVSDKLGATDTYSVDIEVVEPEIPVSITPDIINGDFTDKFDGWKFDSFSGGTTSPFNSSSDGSWLNYDGTDNGSKTAGAKWTSSTSTGPATSKTRYAYQAITVTPNVLYTIEYEYAIKTDNSDRDGGDRVVVEILDGHFSTGAEGVASSDAGALVQSVGNVANGKGNFETNKVSFTSNGSGLISILIYAITNDELYVDNVKVYPLN